MRSLEEPVTLSGHLIEHIKAWTCREKGPPKKKQYVSAKDHLELQHLGGLCPGDRFGCVGNIFAIRAWQFNTAEVQGCRHGCLVSRRWQKSAEGCEDA